MDVAYGTPEQVDPVVAWLMVRTTGSASIRYRQPASLHAEQ